MVDSYYDYFNGNKESLKPIIECYSKPLFGFIFNFVKNETVAEDILEDVFLSLIIKRRHFKNKDAFKAYLYAVARNKSLNYIKRIKTRYVPLEDNFDYSSKNPNELLEEKYDKELVQNALSKLSYDYYTVIYLSYFEDLKNKQIAKIMKKSTKQVENILFRAKLKLKNILKEAGYDKNNE